MTSMAVPARTSCPVAADTDFHTYEDNSSGVTVTLGDGTANDGGTEDGNADSLTGIENLIGSDFDDDLTGDASDNEFTGGDGADPLDGEGGFDFNSYSDRSTPVTADLDAAAATTGARPTAPRDRGTPRKTSRACSVAKKTTP